MVLLEITVDSEALAAWAAGYTTALHELIPQITPLTPESLCKFRLRSIHFPPFAETRYIPHNN